MDTIRISIKKTDVYRFLLKGKKTKQKWLLNDKTLDYLIDNQAFVLFVPLSILGIFDAILHLFDKANHKQNEGCTNRRR